jgi:hypothetical protein
MKKNVKDSKKYKINFGPQCSQKSEHLVIIRTAGVLTFGIQVEIPDNIAIGAGILGGVTVLTFLFYQYLKKEHQKKNVNKKMHEASNKCSHY